MPDQKNPPLPAPTIEHKPGCPLYDDGDWNSATALNYRTTYGEEPSSMCRCVDVKVVDVPASRQSLLMEVIEWMKKSRYRYDSGGFGGGDECVDCRMPKDCHLKDCKSELLIGELQALVNKER